MSAFFAKLARFLEFWRRPEPPTPDNPETVMKTFKEAERLRRIEDDDAAMGGGG